MYFANEIKRTERKKQFLTSESTIKRKRESMIIHGRPHKFLQGGNVNILFMIFKLLTISVPSKIILHWENICFSEHDILGLSKWSFQWITNFVNYAINIHYQITNKLSNYEQNTHFIQIAPCFQGSFHWFGMLQVRENEISLRNSSVGPRYLCALEGTLLTMQCKWTFTKRFILATLQRKFSVLR